MLSTSVLIRIVQQYLMQWKLLNDMRPYRMLVQLWTPLVFFFLTPVVINIYSAVECSRSSLLIFGLVYDMNVSLSVTNWYKKVLAGPFNAAAKAKTLSWTRHFPSSAHISKWDMYSSQSSTPSYASWAQGDDDRFDDTVEDHGTYRRDRGEGDVPDIGKGAHGFNRIDLDGNGTDYPTGSSYRIAIAPLSSMLSGFLNATSLSGESDIVMLTRSNSSAT
jgi:hypothetical protein